ncbi:MAG: hypothetical protein B7X58_13730 [Marinobacter sp. 34-60-7]|nr:MAG: hypothetical protein B7X58_13730 [Marinobacter sp. 34-60-7]
MSLAEPLSPEAVDALQAGVKLRGEDTLTRPALVEAVSEREALLTIQEGRYHQVKRMMAAVGNHVTALHRISIGSVILDPSLAPGEYRALKNDEIEAFR